MCVYAWDHVQDSPKRRPAKCTCAYVHVSFRVCAFVRVCVTLFFKECCDCYLFSASNCHAARMIGTKGSDCVTSIVGMCECVYASVSLCLCARACACGSDCSVSVCMRVRVCMCVRVSV